MKRLLLLIALSANIVSSAEYKKELQRETRAILFENTTNIDMVISGYSHAAEHRYEYILKPGFIGHVALFTPMRYRITAKKLEYHVVGAEIYIENPSHPLKISLRPDMNEKKLGIIVELDGKEIQEHR